MAKPTSPSGRSPFVTLSITFTATSGKIITVYSIDGGGGSFEVSNACPDGAPNMHPTTEGLRATVFGWSR